MSSRQRKRTVLDAARCLDWAATDEEQVLSDLDPKPLRETDLRGYNRRSVRHGDAGSCMSWRSPPRVPNMIATGVRSHRWPCLPGCSSATCLCGNLLRMVDVVCANLAVSTHCSLSCMYMTWIPNTASTVHQRRSGPKQRHVNISPAESGN